MKRVKSCSTLRLKAHQLLNEEEKEILKYAIRNYRKNQSIDNLCDILTKIITDSNRGCIITIIAEMLKEEQRSTFLHRCYTKLPGYNVSQQHLVRTDIMESNNMSNSNLSLKAATFVSKHRTNSHQNYTPDLKSSSSFQIESTNSDSTLKSRISQQAKTIESNLKSKTKLTRSDSDELLKSIEKCTQKARPTLSTLQDKGFWYPNNESATDDDSSLSHSSSQDNKDSSLTRKSILTNHKPQSSVDRINEEMGVSQPHRRDKFHNKTKFSDSTKITPRFFSKGDAKPLVNGGSDCLLEKTVSSNSILVPTQNSHQHQQHRKKDKEHHQYQGESRKESSGDEVQQQHAPSKFVICKLHFSSPEQLEPPETELASEIPAYLQCLASATLDLRLLDCVALNSHPALPHKLCARTVSCSSPFSRVQLVMPPRILQAIRQTNSVCSRREIVFSSLEQPTPLSSLLSSSSYRNSAADFVTDEGCQTSPVLTRDSMTQTYLC